MEIGEDYIDMDYTPPLSTRSDSRVRRVQQNPQEIMKEFWNQFSTKYPGKVYTVLPDNPYARSKAASIRRGTIKGQNAGKSYEQAKQECERAVERIVKECRRVNQRYTDPHFDIEVDLKSGRRDCLDSLDQKNHEMRPKGVKRVTVCFPNQRFG
jgi:hypothetical protein